MLDQFDKEIAQVDTSQPQKAGFSCPRSSRSRRSSSARQLSPRSARWSPRSSTTGWSATCGSRSAPPSSTCCPATSFGSRERETQDPTARTTPTGTRVCRPGPISNPGSGLAQGSRGTRRYRLHLLRADRQGRVPDVRDRTPRTSSQAKRSPRRCSGSDRCRT